MMLALWLCVIYCCYLCTVDGFHSFHSCSVSSRHINNNKYHQYSNPYRLNQQRILQAVNDGDAYSRLVDRVSIGSGELVTNLNSLYLFLSTKITESLPANIINVDLKSLLQDNTVLDAVNAIITNNINNNHDILSILSNSNAKDLLNTLSATELSLTLPIITLVLSIAFVINGNSNDDSSVGSPYDDNNYRYDQGTSDRFYSTKQLYVFRRVLKLLYLTNSFNVKLLFYYLTKSLERNEKVRAAEALDLVTQLGPTFIKLGE